MYTLYIAKVKFEENNKYKKRPVLLLRYSGDTAICRKVTSQPKRPNYPGEVELLDTKFIEWHEDFAVPEDQLNAAIAENEKVEKGRKRTARHGEWSARKHIQRADAAKKHHDIRQEHDANTKVPDPPLEAFLDPVLPWEKHLLAMETGAAGAFQRMPAMRADHAIKWFHEAL